MTGVQTCALPISYLNTVGVHEAKHATDPDYWYKTRDEKEKDAGEEQKKTMNEWLALWWERKWN